MTYRWAVRTASVLPTVEGFLLILGSLLIQQDADDLKKGKGNPYALGHWLAAKEKVEHDLAAVLKSSAPEDLESLKAALSRRFHVNGMAATRRLLKMIDQYLETGKTPKIPISPELKKKIREEKAKARAERAEARAAKPEVTGLKGA